MSWNEFGGPYRLDAEAHRLAFMLNTRDPYAEREAAMQLSQDLYGLPPQAEVDLIRRTQMYTAPGLGAQLVVEPMLTRTWDGRLYDTGNRDVRVVDPMYGINDGVAVLQGTNCGYRQPGFGPGSYGQPGVQFDIFAGVNGIKFGLNLPFLSLEFSEHSRREREHWNDRDDWRRYDGRDRGRENFVHPNVGAGYDTRINDFSTHSQTFNNIYNNVTIKNYYENHVQNNPTVNNHTTVIERPPQQGTTSGGHREFHPVLPHVQVPTNQPDWKHPDFDKDRHDRHHSGDRRDEHKK